MKPPRILVVGIGSIGTRHLSNLHALGVRDLLAFDPQAKRRAWAEREVGATAFSTLGRALLAKPDAAIIATPPSLHVQGAIQASQAGCHLFIEKPLSHHDDARLAKLIADAKRRRLKTFVACNLRFHPGLRQVKRLISSGAIGSVRSASAQFGQFLPDWHPNEDYRRGYSASRRLGGGIILDAIHELDLVRWLLGAPDRVAAMGGHLSGLDIETEDTADILLRIGAKAQAHVHLDYLQRVYRRRIQIIGEQGTIDWDYSDREVRTWTSKSRAWKRHRIPRDWEPNEMYVAEMRHFLDVLQGKARSVQDLKEGRFALRLALAAKDAIRTGRTQRVRR